MMNRLEELWQSADDGASMPLGPVEYRPGTESDDLLDAWYLERRNSIECEILLGQAKGLIARLMSDEPLSPSGRKRARRMIRAIEQALRMIHEDDD